MTESHLIAMDCETEKGFKLGIHDLAAEEAAYWGVAMGRASLVLGSIDMSPPYSVCNVMAMNMKLGDTSPTLLQHLYSAVYIIYQEQKGFRLFRLFCGNIRGNGLWAGGGSGTYCLPLRPSVSRNAFGCILNWGFEVFLLRPPHRPQTNRLHAN